MLDIFLSAYSVFLALLMLFFLAISLAPRRKFLYKTRKNYSPKVLVIIPCKGYDIDLKENLNAVHQQQYRNYDVIAVVDSDKEPALKTIKETKTRFIVSDHKYKKGSGKVAALATAFAKFKDYDVYVILDSDVLTGKEWLSKLVAPLADPRTGLSTSFPIFMPIGGFWSKVKHAWGYVGQGLEEDDRTAFGWGGSLAFRKEILDKKSFDYFAASVSDDLALTRIAKNKGLKIAYVKDAMPIVKSNEDFRKFSEWSTRQTAIFVTGGTKHYGRTLIIYYSASLLLMLSSIILAILVSPWFLIFLLPQVLAAIKLWRRSGHKAYMLALSFVMNFIYLANVIRAMQIRHITWRGKVYDLENISNMRNYNA